MSSPRRPRMLHRVLGLIAVATLASWSLSGAAFGSGSTLYASPTGSGSGSCTSSSTPCSLAYAVSSAVAGDTVIVLPGTYSLSSALTISSAITVTGQSGQTRPSLVGTSSLLNDTVSASGGAILSDLDIETTTNSTTAQTSALSLDGATGENLTLSAPSTDSQGEALSVKDSVAGTVARTILAVSAAPGGEAVSLKDSSSGAGTATVDHLTAIGTGSTTDAISGNVASGTVTITNAIASSPQDDISTKSGTQALGVSSSDYSTTTSGAVTAGSGNISAAPLFANAGSGDYHEAAGSPTIGAGAAQAGQTAADLDGTAWGSPPDMGAYEYVASGTGSSSTTTTSSSTTTSSTTSSTTTAPAPATSTTAATTTAPSSATSSSTTATSTTSASSAPPTAVGAQAGPLPPASPPVAGVSVTLRPTVGTVSVAMPGSGTFVPLDQAAQLPVGAIIDASRGSVSLTSAVGAGGAAKTGTFTGGEFEVTQTAGRHPLTDLRLAGGSFAAACALPTVTPAFLVAGRRALVRTRRRPSHKVVRLLWGSDHGGHFVTIGRSASAAVRGTVWLTEDRCDGTLIVVRRGRVLVHPAGGRGVLVRAGHSYLAHARS